MHLGQGQVGAGQLDVEQRAVDASKGLAGSSAERQASQPDLALLLAVEALNTYDTPEARDAAAAAMPREWWTMAGRLR